MSLEPAVCVCVCVLALKTLAAPDVLSKAVRMRRKLVSEPPPNVRHVGSFVVCVFIAISQIVGRAHVISREKSQESAAIHYSAFERAQLRWVELNYG